MAYAVAPQHAYQGPGMFSDYEARSKPLHVTSLLSPPRSSSSSSSQSASTISSTSPALHSIGSAHIKSLLRPSSPSPPPSSHGYSPPFMTTQSPSYTPATAAPHYRPAPEMMQGVSPTAESQFPAAAPAAPMAVQPAGEPQSPPDESADAINDGRKAKRELSQSKRAAQNRAAQRAFRQRKEHYIKKLEQQVREYSEMEQNYKAIQNDNYALREYVIQLQSRLLDVQVEPPQPPPNVNIAPPTTSATGARPLHPSLPPPPAAPADPASTGPNRGTLADVAAAVAGLSAREPAAAASPESVYPKPPSFKGETGEEARNGEEVRRQMPDGLPHSTLRT